MKVLAVSTFGEAVNIDTSELQEHLHRLLLQAACEAPAYVQANNEPIVIRLDSSGTNYWWRCEHILTDGVVQIAHIANLNEPRLAQVHGGTYAIVVRQFAEYDTATLVGWRPARSTTVTGVYVRQNMQADIVLSLVCACTIDQY